MSAPLSAPSGAATRPPVQRPAPPGAEQTARVRTPTLRAGLRRRRIWLVFAIVLVAGGGLLMLLRGFGGVGGQPLGPADPSPVGAKAVVQVLRGQGVEVIEARSLDRALAAAPGATVLLYDEKGLLDEDALVELAGAAESMVIVEPDFAALRALAPGVRHAGAASGALDEVACDLPAATRAAELADGQRLLTIDEAAAAASWAGCFEDDGAFALVAGTSEPGAELALVGSSSVFANGSIATAGNAALALGLAGELPTLVWYLPGPADAASGGPTLAELTPGWVSPLLALAVVVTIAAGVSRGRRFGRLVVEDLPVEVRAGETVEGRARLYAAASSRTHALDQLRIGTISRLAGLLKLSRSASADEVAAAAASTVAVDPVSVRRLLFERLPAGDAELVGLAAELEAFEQRVRDRVASVGPGSPSDPGRGTRPTDSSGSPTGRRP